MEQDQELARVFRIKQESDSAFAANPYQQLHFIYERSPWSEPTYMRHAVYRSIL